MSVDARAPEFRLPATDGRTYALKDVAGQKGTVIVFICNHCPYVKSVIDRLVADARLLMDEGVGFAAICSNDAATYPEDSFPKMREFANKHGFPFPYLHDETQDVAHAYGAVCTPDFFGFDRDLKLKYRGRLDEGRTTPPPPNARRELLEAMRAIAAGGLAPANQAASIGCSIKWKAGGVIEPQLASGPCIAFSAASTCRQVFASSLSLFRSYSAARWAAMAIARSPCASLSPRAYSLIIVSSMSDLLDRDASAPADNIPPEARLFPSKARNDGASASLAAAPIRTAFEHTRWRG
jgi:peroxiredoxin